MAENREMLQDGEAQDSDTGAAMAEDHEMLQDGEAQDIDTGAAMAEDHEMLQHGEGEGAPLQELAEAVPRGLSAEAQAAYRGPVFVKQIAIRGFKSFRLKAKIGPLSTFSCIIGPNGAGKSVVGEALAFVLGGSARTMRAKCLSALLNEDMRHSGTKLFAKVSVTLEGLESHQVKVSRVITGSTSSYIWSSDKRNRHLSFSEMRQELLNFGIAADISERFIIMQSRQAIKAKQPSDLCEYLEVIFGAGHFRGMITETEKGICEKSNETIMLQEKLTEVQSKIEKLRPEVKKWQSFDSQWHDFQSRKVSYLHFQENTLRCKLQQNLIERDKKLTAYRKAKESKDAIQDLQKNANLETSALKTLLQQKKRALGSLEKRFLDVRMGMVKAQVRVSAAKKDAESKGQEYLEMYQQQDALKKKVADLAVRLDELKERRKELSQQKELLKGKKPKFCHQKSLLEIEAEECSNFVGEDTEDELFVKISKFQEALMAIEREIEGHEAQVFNLSAEVHLIERQSIEMTEARKKRELDALDVQEALRSTLQESDEIFSSILPNLKETLKHNEFELFNLKKKIHSFEKKVNRNSREDKAVELLMIKFKGKFYGRVVDLAKVKGNMTQAVNSVMTHLINTSKTFVTDDRKTANEVISHFQEHKIGVVTCEILSELAEFYQIACNVPNLGQGQHVMEFIQCEDVYKPVFWKYTKNWIIVEDRNAALAFLTGRKGITLQKNIVTFKGDIFKQDGEVISASKNLSGSYLLQGCNDPGLESRHETVSPNQVRNYEARVNYLTERQTILKVDISSNENKLAVLQRQVRELQTRLQNLQESTHIDPFSALSSRLAEKSKALSNLHCKIQILGAEASQLRKVILQLEVSRHKIMSPEMAEWRQRIEILDAEIKSCGLENQQKKSSMKTLLNKLNGVHSLATEVASKNSFLAEAEQKYAQAKEQLDNEGVQKDKMASEVDTISQKLVEISRVTDKYKKKIMTLQRKETELQTQLEKLSESDSDLKDKVDKVLKALPEYSEEVPSKRLLQDFSNFTDCNHLGRDDEDGEGIALAEEELSLKELHRTINPCTLDEDLSYRKEEMELVGKMDSLEKLLNSMKLRKETLENERYNIFTKSVREVNNNLSHIYGSFTKHGDAYLSFTEEKTLLFIEGVNFQVRPGRHKWCSFTILSGGQQALAALALSFSLQLQFPSPFYFFDEIDAALDTKNAQLVANYVKKQTGTQYIIVSHRPQLYEHASTIAGIYHCCGSSRSITSQV